MKIATTEDGSMVLVEDCDGCRRWVRTEDYNEETQEDPGAAGDG